MLPVSLQKGDTVGVVAPAGPIEADDLTKGIEVLESLGLKVKLGKYIYKKYGYLAGTDEERAEDLMNMFADKEVKAIFCARGGYGTSRIAQMLNYETIKQNPKIFLGYSDITYLHTAIRQRTGLVTFHGPMVASDMGDSDYALISYKLLDQLFHPQQFSYTEAISELDPIVHGEAEGLLAGGNLSLLVSTLSTPFEIDTRGAILLIEDIGEPPYRIDAMLNQLKLAGKLKEVKGVVIGDFTGAETTEEDASLSFDQVLTDYFGDLDVPVMKGFKIGHCTPNIPVPLGVPAVLSTTDKKLTIAAGTAEERAAYDH